MSVEKVDQGGGRGGRSFPWKRIGVSSLVVNALLVSWLMFSGAKADSGSDEVNHLVDEYFRVWSAQDMEGYRNCFHPSAVIHFIDGNAVPRSSGRDPFVEGQRQGHQVSKTRMREIPLEKRTEIDGNIARSLVRWKLFNDTGEEVGTDYFTFLKTKTGWKIISLVFRKDG